MRRWKRFVPLLVSVGLLAFLLWRVPPTEFLHALRQLDWIPLLIATCCFVIVQYFLDAGCLYFLFADRQRPVSFSAVLHARGCAYVLMIIHFGLGHGLLAWQMAKRQDKSLLTTGGRCVVLTIIDICVLLTLGLVGAALSSDPRTDGLPLFCGLLLAGLILIVLTLRRLPAAALKRWKDSSWAAKLEAADLTWRQIAMLYPLRLVYFCFGLANLTTALWICGIRPGVLVAMSVIPVTALVDGLPISLSGLGTREAMLINLLDLQQSQQATLMACTIVWWFFLVSARALIGVGCLWMPRKLSASQQSA